MGDQSAQRYSRHIGLPQIGTDGQQRLQSSSALIIGMGGLGATAGLYLANSGVGHLVINDFDRVDSSNLPRQILFQPVDVDRFKVEAAAQRLRAWNPELNITQINRRLDELTLAETVSGCDIVLDCTDNFATRSAINRACVQTGTPLVSGAAIRFEGQLAVFRNDMPGEPCYNCLYSEADENLESCAGQGILASVAGTIGCMMATEAIKRLAGLDTELGGMLWVYDGLAGLSRSIRIKRRADCPVCSGETARV
jgi:molybdopterin/thiamine biosynthesis adenylyltransferase